MSASKYVRPMRFGQLVLSTFRIFLKSFWPFWVIAIAITFAYPVALRILTTPLGIYAIEPWWLSFLLIVQVLFPAFFIGPAMLTISNIVLERPKKTLRSFWKGLSLGMILKIFLYFSPILVGILFVKILHQLINSNDSLFQLFPDLALFNLNPWLSLLFTFTLLGFAPVWVFYPMILILEKKGVFKAALRTWIFISGQFFRLIQIQFLLILLTVLIAPIGDLYYTYVNENQYQHFGPILQDLVEAARDLGWIHAFSFLVQRLTGGLFYIMPLVFGITITVYILHYYQVRAKKENFTEELLAQELGYQPMQEMMSI